MKHLLGLLALSFIIAATASAQQLPSIFTRDLSGRLQGGQRQVDLWYWLSRSYVYDEGNPDDGVPPKTYGDLAWDKAKPEGGWLTAPSQDNRDPDDGPHDPNLITNGPLAQLAKLSNAGDGAGFYFASNSVYSRSGSSELEVLAETPLVDGVLAYQTRTIILQMVIGENDGNTFVGNELPQLEITHAGGKSVIDLEEGFFGVIANESIGKFRPDGAPGEVDLYNNLWAFQWNIRDSFNYTDISSISVSFGLVTHTSLYEVQLDRSSIGYDYFVPEPATYALILGGSVLGLVALRRRAGKKRA